MNKRAQVRLIGVTVIIIIAVAAIIFGAGKNDGAYSQTVAEVAEDQSLVGQRVRVSGVVVPGSWDRKSNPMRFEIRDENADAGAATIKIVYNGQVPSTFGDEVTAIVTGTLAQGGTIDSTNMITKCPSKYESGTGATTVASLLADKAKLEGKPIKVMGYVVAGSLVQPGSAERFKIQEKSDGGEAVSIAYDGAIPEGFADGAAVVIGGSLDSEGVFDATTVALATTGS